VALARRAVDLARDVCDAETEGRALFRLAAAHTTVGDYHLARDTAVEFLTGLAGPWAHLEEELAAKAFSNLGLIHRSRRRYPEALQTYWQALTRFQTTGHVEGEIYTRQQLAWLLIMMGELDEAAEHLQHAGGLITVEAPGYLITVQLTHEAMLWLRRERYPEAAEQAREVLAPGREHVTNANRGVALCVAGMCALQTGQVQTARMFLGLAQEAAATAGLAAVMNLVQELVRAVLAAEAAS
jgi:tetratricopeptide (TPR) repeat protein